MAKPKIPLRPKHPERVCWGCNRYCSAKDLQCGNGSVRTEHPIEVYGEDWHTLDGWSDVFDLCPEDEVSPEPDTRGKPRLRKYAVVRVLA